MHFGFISKCDGNIWELIFNRSRSRNGASTAKLCEACDAGGDLREIIFRTAHPGVPPTTPRAGTIVSGW